MQVILYNFSFSVLFLLSMRGELCPAVRGGAVDDFTTCVSIGILIFISRYNILISILINDCFHHKTNPVS